MLILKVLLISIILIAIAFLGFATQMLLKKGGKFPETSIGHNKDMRKLGITCVRCDELKGCRSTHNDRNEKGEVVAC